MIKPKIGIYGRMNVGKSSLMNLIMGQPTAIVSSTAGTTTDPVRKAYEILDFAPVVLIDTAGFDDVDTELGRQRVEKTIATLDEVDMAILVVDSGGLRSEDKAFLEKVDVPCVVVRQGERNGVFVICDSAQPAAEQQSREAMIDAQSEPAAEQQSREAMIDAQSEPVTEQQAREAMIDVIKRTIPLSSLVEPSMFGDRVGQGDFVLMVCPIDSEAPSGRLILPQVQALRSALDTRAISVVVQPSELEQALAAMKPRLVVTDSQAFAEVMKVVPSGVELTSFSILLSEMKADPEAYRQGVATIGNLRDGDSIMLIEHCSHQTSCEDIARVKIPNMMKQKLGVRLNVLVERRLPADIGDDVKLVVQCGGCMVGRRAIMSNIRRAQQLALPITNYGVLLRKLAEM